MSFGIELSALFSNIAVPASTADVTWTGVPVAGEFALQADGSHVDDFTVLLRGLISGEPNIPVNAASSSDNFPLPNPLSAADVNPETTPRVDWFTLVASQRLAIPQTSVPASQPQADLAKITSDDAAVPPAAGDQGQELVDVLAESLDLETAAVSQNAADMPLEVQAEEWLPVTDFPSRPVLGPATSNGEADEPCVFVVEEFLAQFVSPAHLTDHSQPVTIEVEDETEEHSPEFLELTRRESPPQPFCIAIIPTIGTALTDGVELPVDETVKRAVSQTVPSHPLIPQAGSITGAAGQQSADVSSRHLETSAAAGNVPHQIASEQFSPPAPQFNEATLSQSEVSSAPPAPSSVGLNALAETAVPVHPDSENSGPQQVQAAVMPVPPRATQAVGDLAPNLDEVPSSAFMPRQPDAQPVGTGKLDVVVQQTAPVAGEMELAGIKPEAISPARPLVTTVGQRRAAQGLEHKAGRKNTNQPEFPPASEPVLSLTPGEMPVDVAGQVSTEGSVLADHVVSQIIEQVQVQEDQESSRYEFRLDPPDLGEMVIEFQRDAQGEVTVRLSASHPGTAALLEQHAGRIEQALTDQGLNLSQLESSTHGQAGSGERDAPGGYVPPEDWLAGAVTPEKQQTDDINRQHSTDGRIRYRA